MGRRDRDDFSRAWQRVRNQRKPRWAYYVPEVPYPQWRRVTARVHWEVDGVEYIDGLAKQWTYHLEYRWLICVNFADGRLHGGGVWLEQSDVRLRP